MADHPHLYFTAGEISTIRAKLDHPRFRGDWAAVLAAADRALTGPLIPTDQIAAEALVSAAGAAATCAFVHCMTGADRYGERAVAIAEAALGAPGWTYDMLGVGTGSRFHLRSGMTCRHMGLVYDLMAGRMSAGQRRGFAEACRRDAIEPFLLDCRDPENDHLVGRRTMNWTAVLAGGMGVLLMALHGDDLDLSREIEIARAHVLRYLDWFDDDGSAVEIGGYWRYGMEGALHCLAALRVNGWPDIFNQRAGKIRRSAYPTMCMSVGGRFVANFCDTHYGPLHGRDEVALLAAAYRDRRLQWWADQQPAGSYLALIAGDPELPATAPEDLPTTIVFPRAGVAVLRASYTDADAPLLALKAGRGRGMVYDDPHCQFDLNAIVLEAFGAPLLADPGYGHSWTSGPDVTDPAHPYNATFPHNTLLVDGRGQLVEHSPLAHLQDLSPSAEIDYVVSRLECGYGPHVRRFDRHVYFVGRRFYVVLDDVLLERPAALTWNFHAAKGAAIEAGAVTVIRHWRGALTMGAFGSVPVSAAKQEDHVLPRVQFDAAGQVEAARVGWVLVPHGAGASVSLPKATVEEGRIAVDDAGRRWALPIVARRPTRSSMMLI